MDFAVGNAIEELQDATSSEMVELLQKHGVKVADCAVFRSGDKAM